MEKKKKRTLSNIDFSGSNSHIALVGLAQGGPANGADYALVLKGEKKRSQDFIEKSTKIQVEMTIEEYLERFYNIWGSDATVLAKIFGFDAGDSEEAWDYEQWIEERVESVKILKALKDSDNIVEYLDNLDEDSVLSFLRDQETFEKSLKDFESNKGVDNSAVTKVEKVEPVGSKKVNKGKKMTQEVETIEKSKYEAIEKQMQDQKVELEKARLELQELQKQKAEAINKARTESLESVLKNADDAVAIMKAFGSADAESFDAVVAVLKKQADLLEQSELFKEKGVTVETESKPEQSGAMQILMAKHHNK